MVSLKHTPEYVQYVFIKEFRPEYLHIKNHNSMNGIYVYSIPVITVPLSELYGTQ